MSWFERLTGCKERSPEHVRSKLAVDGCDLVTEAGERICFGRLEIASLEELRRRVTAIDRASGRLTMREYVGDVAQLHCGVEHAGALFQVASQFNLLEMVHPSVTPERGVGIYENDRTQGPVCAIACGAGTIYRNYFVPLGDQVGQTADRQVDCAAGFGKALGNEDDQLWSMVNGYLMPTESGLQTISSRLRAGDDQSRDAVRSAAMIGIQWDADVTIGDAGHRVSQAYCSAVPAAYCGFTADQWEPFARLVLESAYEATFCAAAINAAEQRSKQLFLTLLGGGAFGNKVEWIIDAIERAAERFRDHDLDVAVVSYGRSRGEVQDLVDAFS